MRSERGQIQESRNTDVQSSGSGANEKLPACELGDGVYVRGKVGSVPVTFTADTGASRTVISNRVYEKMSAMDRPQLMGSSFLRGGGGSPIKEWGKGTFEVMLGR